jgi:mono/diheme cytochrome c family protein
MFSVSQVVTSICLSLAVAIPSYAQDASASKAQAVHAGQQVFTQRCFQCHSVLPDQVRFGPSLYGEMKKPHPKKTEAQIRAILINGNGKMPSFKDVLTKEDTDNLLAYLHSL